MSLTRPPIIKNGEDEEAVAARRHEALGDAGRDAGVLPGGGIHHLRLHISVPSAPTEGNSYCDESCLWPEN